MRRALVLPLAFLAGCGGGSEYERRASALCRSFQQAAPTVQEDPRRFGEPYARLSDGLARLSPPEDLRRTHDALLGFARSGARVAAAIGAFEEGEVGTRGDRSRGPGGPALEGSTSLSAYVDDLPAIERDLPACADALTAAHPEIQVIR